MKWFRILMAVAVVASLAPLAIALLASGIAQAFGCRLHEGGVNPCMIAGNDFGRLLNTMFVMGWLSLGTLPLGIGAVLLWVGVELVRRLRRATS